MASAITKSTLISNIWKNFYDRIKDQVTSVTLSISPGTSTIQKYVASYSDIELDSKSNYPVIIINSPQIPQNQFTFGKTKVNGSIELEVYTTSSQSSDKFLDAINQAVETYKGTLAGVGIRMLDIDNTSNDFIERGNIKIHIRSVTWKFIYYFDRTGAF